MTDVTQVLAAVERGDPSATQQLLPLVYEELRRLAAARLTKERPGHTLQPTALVHEAYMRLLGPAGAEVSWNSRGHFFGAAAEAMRRILIENARRRNRPKHGGGYDRVEFASSEIAAEEVSGELLALDEALQRLAAHDPHSAQVVKLRYFAGLTVPQVAEVIGVSPRQVDFLWSFARAWLRREME